MSKHTCVQVNSPLITSESFILSSHRTEKAVIATAAAVAGATVAYVVSNRTSSSSSLSRPAGSSVENPVQGDRTYLIGGNWKCNGTVAENEALIKTFNEAGPIPSNVEVVVCSSYIHLTQLLTSLRADIAVGAQDCGVNAAKGAYTGEVAASQLKDLGCVWVIVGHSERREGFEMPGEPEDVCAKKCKVALEAGLKVMFAIGEKKEEREAGTTMDVCAKQLSALVKVLEPKDWKNVAIAYEPVWAVSWYLVETRIYWRMYV